MSLPEAFEGRVRAHRSAIALTNGSTQVTYAELGDASDRVATAIQSRGIAPTSLVGVSTLDAADAVVAILGILKAGCAYVPLDPRYPAERLRFMCHDAAVSAVVGDADVTRALELQVIPLGGLPDAASPIRTAVRPDHLAYVIYTSGSTGRPKGVCVSHRNVIELLRSADQRFDFGPEDVWTLFHSYSFDFSVWEIWGALWNGGRLVVVPEQCRSSPQGLLALLQSESVTVLNQVPSVFRHLAREYAASAADLSLRYIIFGGEALDRGAAATWSSTAGDAGPALVNMYGITETTVHVTYKELSYADLEELSAATPIGHPLPHLDVMLLDENLRPVTPGEEGEMFISGSGVTKGYLNRPELTSERFVAIGDPPRRFYRSGDIGRLRSDGELEYLGRTDAQVKIRGFRIELGEIEAALEELPGILDAAAVASDNAAGDTQLVAFYVPEARGARVDEKQLRATLQASLPDYMVPVRFVEIPTLPITPSGKLDRRSLLELDRARATDGDGRQAGSREQGVGGNDVHVRLERVFREVFASDLVLSPQDSAATIPEWDSLSHITLMVAIEQEFRMRFGGNELAEMADVEELEAFLRDSER